MLKAQFNKFQEDSKRKDNNNKMIIEKYKNQIEEANNKILELNGILSRLQPKENKNKQNKNKINNKNIQQQINNNIINKEPNLNFNYSNHTNKKQRK